MKPRELVVASCKALLMAALAMTLAWRAAHVTEYPETHLVHTGLDPEKGEYHASHAR